MLGNTCNDPSFLFTLNNHVTRVTALCSKLHRATINAARTGFILRRPHRAFNLTTTLNWSLDVVATPVIGRLVASLEVALRQDSEVIPNFYPPKLVDQIDEDSDEDITDDDLSLIGLQVPIFTNTEQAPFQTLETALALTFQNFQNNEQFQISQIEFQGNITNSLEIFARYKNFNRKRAPHLVQFYQDQLIHKQRQHDTIIKGLQQYANKIIEHIANSNWNEPSLRVIDS